MRNRSERNKTGLKKTKETNVYTKKPKPFVRKTKPNAIKAGEGDEDPDVSMANGADVSTKQELFKEGEIRLNRYIANSGMCSRREADTLIAKGLVTVNGTVLTEMGHKVQITDIVTVEGRVITPEKKVYILLNKPKGYVTTSDDPEGRDTVMDLIKGACTERVYPVGRLDKNTTGVLLLTNDGELTKKLTHPKYQQRKIYHVWLDKNLTKDDMMKIAEGIELEDGFIAADALSYVGPNKDEIGIEIHSGRNRIIRRLFEHLGYDVVKLDRTFFAGLTKKNLQRGWWRHLDSKEVFRLKMNIFS
jgi:23S rRNA pseudouridine2605 synthase